MDHPMTLAYYLPQATQVPSGIDLHASQTRKRAMDSLAASLPWHREGRLGSGRSILPPPCLQGRDQIRRQGCAAGAVGAQTDMHRAGPGA